MWIYTPCPICGMLLGKAALTRFGKVRHGCKPSADLQSDEEKP